MLAALALVVVAIFFVCSRQSKALLQIGQATDLGVALSDTARLIQDGTLSHDEIAKVQAEAGELRQRLADSLEPSLVQAELMKTGKDIGVTLREIQPILLPRQGESPKQEYPRYRVIIAGTYQAIAAYLQRCAMQRLPVRVVELTIRSASSETDAQTSLLTADITVEAFQPPSPEVTRVSRIQPFLTINGRGGAEA